jgi:GNAT superfamily N-acetyltransferase
MHILPYTDALAPHFHTINAAWIADMFVLEPHDEHVLSHPREAIVDKGGVILFAATRAIEDGGTVVGTGALIPTEPGACELTKMGVLAETRGTGAGAMLLAALIDRARTLPGLDTLYLLTSHKCAAAIHLYEKAGFVHDADIMARFGASYARCDVAMRYPLDPAPARASEHR